MTRILVPLAEGFEEIEAVTLIDLLRRAGIEVTVAGVMGSPVTGSHGIVITPDCLLDDALQQEYDMIVLPGGLPGAEHLKNDARVTGLIRKMADSGKYVGAVCAAPIALAEAGVLEGKKATSYPGFLDKIPVPGMTYTGSAVERDGNVLTSRGPGTAMDFALAIIETLLGAETRRKLEQGLMRP